MTFLRESCQLAILFAVGYPLACARWGRAEARRAVAEEVGRILVA